MKILSRTLVALLLLVGLAFLFIQNRVHAAAGATKCRGHLELKLGLDTRNCECVEPEHGSKAQLERWLKNARVGPECYKIKVWKKHHVTETLGNFDDVQCLAKEDDKCPQPITRQPLGTSFTQRVMFNTKEAVLAFTRQLQAAKETSLTKK